MMALHGESADHDTQIYMDADLSFLMDSIMLLYLTLELIIICTPVTDVI